MLRFPYNSLGHTAYDPAMIRTAIWRIIYDSDCSSEVFYRQRAALSKQGLDSSLILLHASAFRNVDSVVKCSLTTTIVLTMC